MADWDVARVYSDRKYVWTTSVRHDGTTIAFAMDDRRRICYTVLDLDREDVPAGSPDAVFWGANPLELSFPAEITTVGYAAAGNTTMPTVKLGGSTEVDPARVQPQEVDPFLSSTARLTAGVPFQVVSDGTYVVVFRLSVQNGHPTAVYELMSGGTSGVYRTDYVLVNGAPAPVVDENILCDRFLLVGGVLQPLGEVRYRRSRDKIQPASGTDSLGTTDMDGNPFVEPTQRLAFVGRVSGGTFAVLLLPTVVSDLRRWQIFVPNDATGRIDAYNVEQGDDGLFDTEGTQLWTSPDPNHASDVLERNPGIDQFTGQPLVPVVPVADQGEPMVRLLGTGYVDLSDPGPLQLQGAFTVEVWISVYGPAGVVLAKQNTAQGAGFSLGVDAAGEPVLSFGTGQLSASGWSLTSYGPMTHVAAVFDGTVATLYVNGSQAATGTLSFTADSATPMLIGARYEGAGPGSFFEGEVGEVRIWGRARTADEVSVGRRYRLIGNEPDLVAYYRFDEGEGATVFDATDSCLNGTLQGSYLWASRIWWAQVPEGPGLTRRSFQFAGRTVDTGLTATLYFQQERAVSGYGGPSKPAKVQARVLLACGTHASPQAGVPGIATLDFAVSREGRLARVPNQVDLPVLGRPNPTQDLAAISASQQSIADLQGRIVENQAVVAAEAAAEQQIGALEQQLQAFTWILVVAPLAAEKDVAAAMVVSLQQQLAPLYAQRAAAQAAAAQVVADQAALAAQQRQLAALTGGLQGGDVTISMPLLGTDTTGLAFYGGLLAFAWTSFTPYLLDSATGDVVLYFRGSDGQFFAAYYDTDVVRSAKQLDAGGSPFRLVATDPAIMLAGVSVTVAPGSSADKCNVSLTLSDGTLAEEYLDVPRQADQFAAVLNGTLDMQGQPWPESVGRPGQALGRSQLVAVDPRGLTAPVSDGSATDVVAGQACRWHGDAPGRAFLFDGRTQCLALPAAQLAQASVPGDLTIEAWVNPDIAGPRGRVLDANADGAQYTLGLSGVQAMTALSFNGSTDFIDCGATVGLANTDFTVELWARRLSSGRDDFLVVHGSPTGTADQNLHFGFRATNVFTFAFWADDLDTGATYTDNDWHHWAGVYQVGTATRILYRDGVEVARDTPRGGYAGAGDLAIGRRAFDGELAQASLDEIRVWNRARTADDISVTMNRRLTGNEAGLLAYWSFPNGQTADLSGNAHDGRVNGQPALVASPIASYQIVAGMGPDYVRSHDVFPAHEWSHLAVALEQSWAVHLDGSSYLDVDPADALNLGHEWTIEVFFQLDKLGVIHGLLSKGVIADNDGGGVPYALGVDPSGALLVDMERPPGVGGPLTVPAGLQPGVIHRIAVIRQPAAAQLSQAAGSPQDEIDVYVDGQSHGSSLVPANWAPTNTSTLELGRSRVGATANWLCGTLAEVRLWNVARSQADLGAPVAAGAQGLVARWHFPENAGNTTRDDGGSYPARLVGATWTKDPDPLGSRVSLYHNGMAAAAGPLDPADPLVTAGYGEPQLTLGGRTAAGTLQEPFAGTLEEVRVWRTARTQQEIEDNLFTRLRTTGDDLVAYYPFDAASTVAGAPVRDGGPRGNDLTPPTPAQAPAIVLSTAPVSSDIPQVRSALTGVPTSFNELIDAPPGVGEYGTLERGSGGSVSGELKRCYSYVRNGVWHLVAGYKIGDLVADWLGQAQFDPQLYGYIEGAPPVPSENMTAGPIDPVVRKDLDASKVTFVQADEVTNTLSSSREGSFQFGAKLSIEAEIGGEVWTVTAPLGVGTAEPLAKVKGDVGLSVAFDMDIGWSSDVEVSQATNVARSTSVALTGDWEDPNHVLFPGAGRRYVPVNTGFALVQSETADVFALRMAHNSAVVAYRMLPNPDIPRDWNIIPFPINPRYTKQGTLDGAIGYDLQQVRALDPDYPMAGQPGEYSYFKPSEAYALKRRIQLEQQRLQGLYDSASTYAVGGGADPASQRAAQVLAGMSGGPVPTPAVTGDVSAAAQSAARRNLVNTYVWTAEGGFFAETTETTDSVSETTGGSFSWNVEASVEGGIEFEALDAVGMSIGFELSFGGGQTTTRRKARESTQTFSLDVECDLARSLQQFTLPDLQGVFDAAGNPVPAPGKVDAYRFMTFYLDSSRENFEDFYGKVVDPTWLTQSEEPNAVALRQAQQSDKKPPCWRVLHRVTFVSRLLPDLGTPGNAPVEDAMKTLDISSSYDLISRLDPYVRRAATSIATLTTATNNALAAQLPALTPHAPQIISFLALYYGVER